MWHPISTAPLDETEIVLLLVAADGEKKVSKAFWSEEYKDWFECECDSHSLTEFSFTPTLWTELP